VNTSASLCNATSIESKQLVLNLFRLIP